MLTASCHSGVTSTLKAQAPIACERSDAMFQDLGVSVLAARCDAKAFDAGDRKVSGSNGRLQHSSRRESIADWSRLVCDFGMFVLRDSPTTF